MHLTFGMTSIIFIFHCILVTYSNICIFTLFKSDLFKTLDAGWRVMLNLSLQNYSTFVN